MIIVSRFSARIFWLICACACLHATVSVASGSQQTENKIEEITVYGRAIGKQKIEFDKLASVSHLDLEDLNRRQSNDVFEALDSVAGLSIEGGLRTRGKSFSIRGFSDNEDVLLVVDGVPQNFEKYRSGSSVEIETELLKEIAVFRGGSAVNQSADHIGGAIIMETKDASDFLLDGQRFGANAKAGWHSNNQAQRYLLNLYGKPTKRTDFIISGALRETEDFRLPNGDDVPDSAEEKNSGLTKFEYATDSFDVSLSYRLSDGEGREPLDSQSASPLFGVVRRQSDETATTFRFNYHPTNGGPSTSLTVGTIDKSVIDIGGNLNNNCPETAAGEQDYDSPLCGSSRLDFDILTARLSNRSKWHMDELKLLLEFGVQYTDEQRQSTRRLRLDNGTADNFSDDRLTERFNNPNQPPGSKTTRALYADYTLSYKDWKLTLGARHDRITITPDDAETKRLLALRGGGGSNGSSIDFSEVTPSAELSWNPKYFSVFYRYRENFRPPLADELFSRNLNANDSEEVEGLAAFLNRCDSFSFFQNPPPGPNLSDPQYQPLSPTTIAQFEADELEHVNVVQSWRDNTNDALERDNSFCGGLYTPENSVTMETGFSINLNEVFKTDF